jgi:TM2 domain-containing membrane protein YozV|tara:strand:+ start:2180 stop:2395 length:216 start_codon:yes stop_codon:yes gene_type:complete
MEKSEKGFVPALILCILLGGFGAHRFYVGKPLTAILMILTLGGLGIWALIDLIVIATGGFKDSKGLKIKAN